MNNETNNTSVETTAEATGAVAQEEEVKTYTKEEVLSLLQSETDRRVSEALKKQQKKYEKELSLSKLDGSEREKAEKDNRIAELEEQLAQYQIERNKSELKSVLSSRGLPIEFADIINIPEDIEEAQAVIDKLNKLFDKAVKETVEKRIAGSAPKGNGATATTITKDSVKKMSIAELQQLRKTNPELYNNLYN